MESLVPRTPSPPPQAPLEDREELSHEEVRELQRLHKAMKVQHGIAQIMLAAKALTQSQAKEAAGTKTKRKAKDEEDQSSRPKKKRGPFADGEVVDLLEDEE